MDRDELAVWWLTEDDYKKQLDLWDLVHCFDLSLLRAISSRAGRSGRGRLFGSSDSVLGEIPDMTMCKWDSAMGKKINEVSTGGIAITKDEVLRLKTLDIGFFTDYYLNEL